MSPVQQPISPAYLILSSTEPKLRLSNSTVGVDDIDKDRLVLNMLAQRLFLVAGPIRQLDGDFPDGAA